MKELDFDKESEKALENWLLQKYDPINWDMGYSCELEDLPAIIPLIEIKDTGGNGRTFMFGNDIHDTLVVETANNRSGIYYLNLQNSCSSRFCDEGYEIVDNGNIKGDYVEPHIRLVNLKQCIERYNKNNGIDELKKENKELRKLGKDYAKQCEDNYNKVKELNQQLAEKDGKITDLQSQLAEKDKRIKELKEENQQLKEQRSNKEETYKHIMSGEYIPANIAEKSLKLSEQSQKQLAIEVLQEVKEKFGYKNNSQLVISSKYLCDFIDNQINQLKEME